MTTITSSECGTENSQKELKLVSCVTHIVCDTMTPIELLVPKCQVSNGVMTPNDTMTPIKNTDTHTLEVNRMELLARFHSKQLFRVSVGKSQWIPYETFKPEYNLREILKDEIVIEFDSFDPVRVWRAIFQTCINLARAEYTFQLWEHGGRSPHLHIHDLPIALLDDNKRALFKKMFIKKYVDKEDQDIVDYSLTGCHMIALEYANHWKGCYCVKLLYYSHPGGVFPW